MRIALLTDGITPYVTGGMQRHSFNLCRTLARLGVHIDLYHCDPEKKGAEALECFSPEEKKMITPFLIDFPDFGKMPGHYIRESYEYAQRIYRTLRKQARVDFIYAKGFTAWEVLNKKSKGEDLPPVGVNLHGYEMFQRKAGLRSRLEASLFLKPPAKFAITHADYLFSYGGKITSLLLSLGVDSHRIVSIPGGIGTEWLTSVVSPVHTPIKFLFAGRPERRKGIKELNAAIRLLQSSDRGQFEFSFLGPITDDQKVAGCNYYGEISDPDAIRKVYAAHDVLCAPSYSEGMPNVIMEAMASGLAIIATDVGAVSILVKPENGWLLNACDVKEIHGKLQLAIRSAKTELEEKKKSSHEIVQAGFTWERIGAQTLHFIEKTVNKVGS